MILTKSVYMPRERGDGVRVLVARFYPRGVRRSHFGEWARELAPSAGLLAAYRGGEATWAQFAARYRREVRGSEGALRSVGRLRSMARRGRVTLLCYEPAGAPCHRHLLAEMIGGRPAASARARAGAARAAAGGPGPAPRRPA